jgi:hypothetical protein
LKTKDKMSDVKMLDVAKQWHAEIADLRHKDQMVVVMRDNAGGNTSKSVNAFTEKGVWNDFGTPCEL